MNLLLILLLAANTVAHGLLVVRFGAPDNMPFAIYTVIYAVLTLVVLFALPFALWLTFILALVGFVGLIMTYRNYAHDRSLDLIMGVLDAGAVIVAGYLLFLA